MSKNPNYDRGTGKKNGPYVESEIVTSLIEKSGLSCMVISRRCGISAKAIARIRKRVYKYTCIDNAERIFEALGEALPSDVVLFHPQKGGMKRINVSDKRYISDYPIWFKKR